MAFLTRLALAAAAAASLLPSARAATVEQCQALLGSVPLAQDRPTTAEPAGTDGCRFTGVRFAFGPRFGYEVGSLTEHGIPPGPPRVPTQRLDVQIEARDIVFSLHSGQAKADWLNRQQQVPFDIVVNGSYDPGKREIVLQELSMAGRSVGQTSLSAVLADVDPDTPDRVGLRSLTLHLDSRRFIVAFLLAPMLSILPDDDPGGAFERAKSQVSTALQAALAQGGAAPETVAAMAGFIADLPHPQHVFDLSVTAQRPVTMDGLMRAASDPALAALLRTLTLTATYAGEPR